MKRIDLLLFWSVAKVKVQVKKSYETVVHQKPTQTLKKGSLKIILGKERKRKCKA